MESLDLAERVEDKTARRRQGLSLSVGAGAWTLLAATPCRLTSITVTWAGRIEVAAQRAREVRCGVVMVLHISPSLVDYWYRSTGSRLGMGLANVIFVSCCCTIPCLACLGCFVFLLWIGGTSFLSRLFSPVVSPSPPSISPCPSLFVAPCLFLWRVRFYVSLPISKINIYWRTYMCMFFISITITIASIFFLHCSSF